MRALCIRRPAFHREISAGGLYAQSHSQCRAAGGGCWLCESSEMLHIA